MDIIQLIKNGISDNSSELAVKQLTALRNRYDKAIKAIDEGRVYWDSTRKGVIVEGNQSSTETFKAYRLRVIETTGVGVCDCVDTKTRKHLHGGWCWHRLAAKVFLLKESESET